ncbi:hypothetical protein RFI_19029 [Reticulomyxa filosa]|uniref:Uncharacterized protein n=1 Tax=Reticulomyxa filosa TaxID=46433 RepID=X6MYW0_RETFI|nr:hypothetical protein RFI_19029 [Reticulomyxa filosa]|eukprot:ETO18250.1 hypothetical protein RFI_19029 [Reticulomyxa filosa]
MSERERNLSRHHYSRNSNYDLKRDHNHNHSRNSNANGRESSHNNHHHRHHRHHHNNHNYNHDHHNNRNHNPNNHYMHQEAPPPLNTKRGCKSSHDITNAMESMAYAPSTSHRVSSSHAQTNAGAHHNSKQWSSLNKISNALTLSNRTNIAGHHSGHRKSTRQDVTYELKWEQARLLKTFHEKQAANDIASIFGGKNVNHTWSKFATYCTDTFILTTAFTNALHVKRANHNEQNYAKHNNSPYYSDDTLALGDLEHVMHELLSNFCMQKLQYNNPVSLKQVSIHFFLCLFVVVVVAVINTF